MAESSTNSRQEEIPDFSGLFKLDVLLQMNIVNYSYYEIGLAKFIAFFNREELLLFYIDKDNQRFEKNYEWDFVDNPIHCVCFEPSGTWVVVVSDEKILLVPLLPLFNPNSEYDHKWSLTSVSVLPFNHINITKPSSVTWWLTKDCENYLIVGCKTGSILFYSLESQSVVGESIVADQINNLEICYDDSLDLLELFIFGSYSKQWKLVLEHRSFGYNWLQQMIRIEKAKKDKFATFLQSSKDKMTLMFRGGTDKNGKPETAEYVLTPTQHVPYFINATEWDVSIQNVNGEHFVSVFEPKRGILRLEGPDKYIPLRTTKPRLKRDKPYKQCLWSKRLLYLTKRNEIEVHSTTFSDAEESLSDLLEEKQKYTLLWSAEVIGDVRRAHLMSVREPPAPARWRPPASVGDLQMPRFSMEPCLVVTTKGAYILNTVCEPCEWLVSMISRGAAGSERAAAALGAPLPPLLRAAADLLLGARPERLEPAHRLYTLAKGSSDGWVARLGAFGRLAELQLRAGERAAATSTKLALATSTKLAPATSTKLAPATSTKLAPATSTKLALATSTKLALTRLLSGLLRAALLDEEFKPDMRLLMSLRRAKLYELCSLASRAGLWGPLAALSVHRGHPRLLVGALSERAPLCRGAVACLLDNGAVLPCLLETDGHRLLAMLEEISDRLDTHILKRLCLFLNPLQDLLRPVMRDLRQDINNDYTKGMRRLIRAFARVASSLDERAPAALAVARGPPAAAAADTWLDTRGGGAARALSCGHAHWALVDGGEARLVLDAPPGGPQPDARLHGRALHVACGRHHTLLLTENGIYSMGDNTYGQLGVGEAWAGGVGEAGSAGGALLYVRVAWPAPLLRVAAGQYHSAAIDAGGRLYTWGWGVHGQLGHGSIEDVHSPQLVTRFQGRKVLSVGCGVEHTVALMRNGEVWACGAGAFGQLGGGAGAGAGGGPGKAAAPVRVRLPHDEPVAAVAAGHFHTLALTQKGQLYSWGANRNMIRAAHVQRAFAAGEPAEPLPLQPHLSPRLVDTAQVRGRIVQMAAGLHHSCLINDKGKLYVWGLNYDGQLGIGSRMEVLVPTECEHAGAARQRGGSGSEDEADGASGASGASEVSGAMVGCGSDFTVYVDPDGAVFVAGNTPETARKQKNNRVLRIAKRIVNRSTKQGNEQLLLRKVNRVSSMLAGHAPRPDAAPLRPARDSRDGAGLDDVVALLAPWIDDECLNDNANMAAKLAFHNNMYQECLRLSLEHLLVPVSTNREYYAHTGDGGDAAECDSRRLSTLVNVTRERVKEISLALLNEESYPAANQDTYKDVSCLCKERDYLNECERIEVSVREDVDLSAKAATVVDNYIELFPTDPNLWEACFALAKRFFIDNNLNFTQLEEVFRRHAKSNAKTILSAISFSNESVQYDKLLTPKFHLNICGEVLDTWG